MSRAAPRVGGPPVVTAGPQPAASAMEPAGRPPGEPRIEWPETGPQPGTDSQDHPAEGFGEFVELRWLSLVRFGYLLTGDWAAAEDLTQSALERTWRRWDRVRVARPESYVKAAM